MSNKEVMDTDAEVLELAEQIKVLLMFAGALIPKLDLLKRFAEDTTKNRGRAATLAPILGAVGLDYEEAEQKEELNYKRANALYNLVKVLKETEDDRQKFEENNKQKAEVRKKLKGIF